MVRAARRDGFCAMFFAEAVRDEGFAKLHTRLWEIWLGRDIHSGRSRDGLQRLPRKTHDTGLKCDCPGGGHDIDRRGDRYRGTSDAFIDQDSHSKNLLIKYYGGNVAMSRHR
jgi:hypothetical protein